MFDTKWTLQRREPNLAKGAIAGLVGGLAASWVMNQFQAAVPAKAFKKLLGETDESGGGSGSDDSHESAEPTTVKAAEAVSEGAFDHKLTDDEKAWAGPAVHYSLGSSAGLVYGLLAEADPRVTAGGGLPFGAAFWLVADEATVPALGLSKAPWQFPPSTHVYSFVSHLVYGLTTEAVRRLVRRML